MNSKTSKFQTLLSVLFLMPLFAFSCIAGLGCAGGGGEAESEGSPAEERRFLSLGTAPAGGAFFVVGGALAEVLDQDGPESWQVTAEATQGSQENIRRLVAGQLDLALSNAAITYHAVRGEGSFDQAYDVRAVMTLAPNVALFVTRADSGVESISDLAGKRIVVGPAGAGFEMFVGKLVEAHGVTYEDFTPLNDTQSGAVDQLADGSAAAAFLGGAVPTASITQASTSMDVRFVPFDPEIKQSLIETYPFFHPATIPSGTYRNQDQSFEGMNVGSMHLITSASVDDDVIYQVTKTLYEQRAAVVERHPAGKAIQPGNVVRDTGTPFHPGAERFYREIGIWPEAAADMPAEAADSAENSDG
ncbi:MAG: TAXI family TRAP transporter solute-binding subunit [Thermoanaerobaculia bacterium]|nr:TAXI family TRAP transporter solute-binding subunit [Thermoanaerobaculia bacterium]